MKNNPNGFTLVELAIVIVIIGLLVGGVLQGKELIESSRRQSIMKGFQMLDAGYFTFKSKYDCLPGDCPKAQQLFGVSKTSNGNGDLKTNEYTVGIEHLSLANIIPGSYLYTNNNSGGGYKPCVNTPCPFGDRSGYQMNYYGSDAPTYFQPYGKRNGNTAVYAGNNDEGNSVMVGGVMTPMDAYIFDSKFDDGLPDSGKIFGGGGHRNSTFQSGCTQNYWSNTSPQTYQTQNNQPTCILVYFIE